MQKEDNILKIEKESLRLETHKDIWSYFSDIITQNSCSDEQVNSVTKSK